MRKPSPFATSSRASLIAVKGTAAMLSVDTDNSQEQSHSDAMVSPVAGLPVQPERGMLHGPLATLQLVLHRVELTPQPSKGWWVVLKVGPHWARSSVRRSLEFAWQLSVPIYHPTTTLILVVFEEAGRGKLNFLGKLQYRISYLMYLNKREVIKSLKLRVSGSSSQQQQHPNGGCSSNSMDASQLGAQTGGGAGSQISGVVLLGFTCSIPDRGRLLNAYERSPYPPTVHYISLFHAASRDSIIQSHHHKVVNWLSKEADPPIPPVAAWKVLETGRDKFKLARARHNIQRLKAATSWVPAIHGYFIDLKAWVRPTHNIISVIIMAAVCFRPMVTLFAFLLWRSVVALRRLLMHVSSPRMVVTCPGSSTSCLGLLLALEGLAFLDPVANCDGAVALLVYVIYDCIGPGISGHSCVQISTLPRDQHLLPGINMWCGDGHKANILLMCSSILCIFGWA
eukprot:GHRR01015471.1.p1 GENE.GHRR01015471.1~~GHRR01015471.1.p1  ORF type:complete len:454 (+),score=127.55 GHRR01015471.1:339-1700(+)